MMLSKEIWCDIKDYEGLYRISNLGRVKSIIRYKQNHSKSQLVDEIILKPSINNKGYYYVTLNKDGKQKHKIIHRLIAETFIPNPNNFPCVNHIDGNKMNNDISNLEWCSYSHNNKEAYRLGLKIGATKNKYGYDNWLSKHIYQYDLSGKFIKKWACSFEVERKLGIKAGNIRSCCNGKRQTAGGYIWKHESEVVENAL